MNSRFRIPDWLFLLAFCGFFFFWKLSSFGLIGADEPRYAQVAREMLARHDWITPTLGGGAWLEKPPLYYWQAMVAYRLFGVSDWAARLPSAFDALLLVLAVYWFLRRFRSGMELDGALMLATCAGIVGYARAASMDMALAATFGMAMLAWYAWFESERRAYLAAFYAFVAVAMLAKGPVAPFLAGVIIAAFAASQSDFQIVKRTLWAPGIVLFFAVGFPWYIAAQLQNPQFFRVFILQHNLARFGTKLYHHPEPFWYYIPVTLLAWVPWSVFAVAGLIYACRCIRHRDSDLLNSFWLIWIAITVAFFSISQSKLPGYVLPAVPAGMVLAAQYVSEKTAQRPVALLVGLHALVSSALIFCALMMPYSVQRLLVWNRAAVAPLIVALAIAALVVVGLVKGGYRMLRIATLAPAIVAMAVALRSGSAPLDEILSTRPVVRELAHFDPHHLTVAVFLVPRETEFGLGFYRDQAIPRYELGQIPQGEHLVVAAAGFQKSIAEAAVRKVVYLGSFAPQKLEFFYVPAR